MVCTPSLTFKVWTNLVAKDRAMWLAHVRTQLVSNLEKMQRQYKENVDEHWKEQPSFKVEDQVWL